MCGIAGVIIGRETEVDRGRLLAALDKLRHRGPDDAGVCISAGSYFEPLAIDDTVEELRLPRAESAWRSTQIALGHRRLSIIDLSPCAHQPMLGGDFTNALVFNGEVYNYLELAQVLEPPPAPPFGDTAVVRRLLEERWMEALPLFSGMFALCFVDLRLQKALLARDPFGIKPLYYARVDGGMAFASEIKALLELMPRAPKLQPQRAYDYLRFGQTEHAKETLFAGVYELPPASWIDIDLNRPGELREPVSYWEPSSALVRQGFDAATQELRSLFQESVRLHLRSDTPVGAALSGGIDSSSLVMTMRELEGPNLDLHTFTYKAADEKLDETAYAEIVAKAASAIEHVTCPAPRELANQLDSLIYMQDLPFNSTSIYAQYKVFELARQVGIKVTLDGQGADELFAGYDSYLAARLASLLKHGHLTGALSFASRASHRPSVSKSQLWKQAVSLLLPSEMQGVGRKLAGEELVPGWLRADWLRDHAVNIAPPERVFGTRVLADYLVYSTTQSGLPSLLRYADRNSMAHSIESRVPFLTVPLANLAFSQPESHMIDDDGHAKCLLRAAMLGVVPDQVLDRKDKMGFITPEAKWLSDSGSPAHQIVASIPADGVIDGAKVNQMLDAIRAGRSTNTASLWRCLNFTRWCEVYGVY
ncbi:MAG: asparagine synthase (glutamine-hydrolyzing) [Fimbriimonadaceae bacterium]